MGKFFWGSLRIFTESPRSTNSSSIHKSHTRDLDICIHIYIYIPTTSFLRSEGRSVRNVVAGLLSTERVNDYVKQKFPTDKRFR